MSSLERLREAIQAHAQSREDEPVILDVAVVVWEQTTMDNDGRIGRRINWCIPTDNFSLSSAFGLLELGHEYMFAELMEPPDD